VAFRSICEEEYGGKETAAAAESTEAEVEVTTSPPSAAAVHPVESFAPIGSIGSSIGSHKERRGAQYDPEQGSIKFADDSSELTEHATNIDDERHKPKKPQRKKKKKNILVRFEEATYKQNLAEQAMDESKTTEAIWSNAAQYDSDVEHLFTYVQVFGAALSSFAHGANQLQLSYQSIKVAS